jgi:hypothetical protein
MPAAIQHNIEDWEASMGFQEILVRALADRFGDRDLRLGTPPEPTARFPARHPDVGDAIVSAQRFGESVVAATVAIGDVLSDEFFSLDTHLDASEQAERVTSNVVRFLEHLFADRLVFWQSADQRRTRGWRECRDATQPEPLVSDDRTYDVYLWSGPLPQWRATTIIFGRRAIRDEREYGILLMCLNDPYRAWDGAEQDLARQLIAQYERRRS